MTDARDFRQLMERVRQGDAEAAAVLIREYEPEIVRSIRFSLTDRRLRRTLDSMDVCQSVLAKFFVRAAAGQFDLDEPAQLLRLLITMAKNKVIEKARHDQAQRRDVRRLQGGGSKVLANMADGEATPSRVLMGRELLHEVRARLTPEERLLAEQRAQGRAWNDLARELGQSPEALRKRLTRALDRIAGELDLT